MLIHPEWVLFQVSDQDFLTSRYFLDLSGLVQIIDLVQVKIRHRVSKGPATKYGDLY